MTKGDFLAMLIASLAVLSVVAVWVVPIFIVIHFVIKFW